MAMMSPSAPTAVNYDGKTNYKPALISLAVLYFMMGFITVMNDSLVPFFKAGFTLSYSQSSLVQFYFFLTYAVVSIPAGKVVERIGYKNGMVYGFVIASFGAFLFYPASAYHQYALFLAALFVLAIGIVLLQVAANPYITVLGSPKTAASRLTLIQGIGSLGTTLAPIFGAHFILSKLSESNSSSDAVVKPYMFIALTLLVIGISVYLLKLPRIGTSTIVDSSITPKGSIFRYRNLNLGIIAIFAYVGAEVSIGTFLTNYIADKLSVTDSAANFYLSYYWGGMLVGRFIGAAVLKYVKPSTLLAILAAISLTLILVSTNSEGMLSVWSMVAIGLCNSVMFAVIFSLSVKGLGNYTTQASGLLSSAIVGGAIISYSQGLLKDHYTWGIAFLVPVACYLYLVFYGLKGYQSRLADAEAAKSEL